MEPSWTLINTLISFIVVLVLALISTNAIWMYHNKKTHRNWKEKFEANLLDKRDEDRKRLEELRDSDLSQREFEVLQLVVDYDPEAIAEKLFLSIHTVNKHLQSIRRKLKIANIREMVPYSETAKLMQGV